MAEQFTSLKVVADKVTRHPLLKDISLETMIDQIIDFMRLVGVP